MYLGNSLTRTDAEARDKVEPTIRDALIGAAIGVLLIYAGSFIGNWALKWVVVGLGWIFVAVMTAFVVSVIWENVSGHVWAASSRLRGDVRKDPQLGRLERDRRSRSWEATLERDDRTVKIVIEGVGEPHAELVAAARDLVARFEDLERKVDVYVAEEAESAAADDPEMAAEIRALRISSVKLYWPDQPGRVQIDFDGPDEDRYWSCEYVDGAFGALDYD